MESFLVKCGAPTLAGLKSGSLFDLPYRHRHALGQALARQNRRLNPRGLFITALRVRPERVLVLLYRKVELEELLKRKEERSFLESRGYPAILPACIQEMRRRLTSADFPHEIGLLLGYPLADVKGFMADCHRGKTVGCWKVYGDETAARIRFSMYKACTAAYCSLYLSGRRLEQLVVPAMAEGNGCNPNGSTMPVTPHETLCPQI